MKRTVKTPSPTQFKFTKRKDVDFWKNLASEIVPFDHPLFNLNNTQFKNSKNSICKFRPNMKKAKKRCGSKSKDFQYYDKSTQTVVHNTPFTENIKRSQSDLQRTHLDKTEKNYMLLNVLKYELESVPKVKGDLLCRDDVPLSTNKLDKKIGQSYFRSSKLYNPLNLNHIKSCHVLVERLQIKEKQSQNYNEQITSHLNNIGTDVDKKILRSKSKSGINKRLEYGKAVTTSSQDNRGSGVILNAGSPIVNLNINISDKCMKLNMCPRVYLRRIEDSVSFLGSFNLRPNWDYITTNFSQSEIQSIRKTRKRR